MQERKKKNTTSVPIITLNCSWIWMELGMKLNIADLVNLILMTHIMPM